ncbi:NAD(P)/FAD-dependent oxidoreductase [uncultured Kriegella sp.]|uniref:NAD(P)/FAD-dependent oxidoreductase n=1 Tax=uncultured Kriegella sp. TaxID=1798910 RepID=UPI0030D7D3A3
MEHYDVIVIGGGLAGLTGAIQLTKQNYGVLVLEKEPYPRHKVCGEYVSNEVVPYLKTLGIELEKVGAVAIDTLQLSTWSGKSVQTHLPLGGFGISRYRLDHLLYQKAVALGVSFRFEEVTAVNFQNDGFSISITSGSQMSSKVVLGAFGKRSNLDKYLNRDFIQKKSQWLGVKAHYSYDAFRNNLVALHNFKGGYAGLSKTETGDVNFCYLASYSSFKQEKDVERFNANVVAQNPFLGTFLKDAEPIFDKPLTIAQVSFESKRLVENHLLMCGDTAGLIHPLCGNGMAMAIHSAKMASECIIEYFNGRKSREQMERAYEDRWRNTFSRRLWTGRQLQSLLLNEKLANWGVSAVTRLPFLLRTAIKSTHGTPID